MSFLLFFGPTLTVTGTFYNQDFVVLAAHLSFTNVLYQDDAPPPAEGTVPSLKLALGKSIGKGKGKSLSFSRKGKNKAATPATPAVSGSLSGLLGARAVPHESS